MDRRSFISTVASAVVALPLTAGAQRAPKAWRIGNLGSGTREQGAPLRATLSQALQELGYVEGKNVEYVVRAANGRIDRLPRVAADLVELGVDVIITAGSEETRAAKQANKSIPIVFLGPSYPVEE